MASGAGAGAVMALGLITAGRLAPGFVGASRPSPVSPGAGRSGRSFFTTVLFNVRTSNTAPCAFCRWSCVGFERTTGFFNSLFTALTALGFAVATGAPCVARPGPWARNKPWDEFCDHSAVDAAGVSAAMATTPTAIAGLVRSMRRKAWTAFRARRYLPLPLESMKSPFL